jgi:CDP-diacylglycerol pyrophosphatase
MSTEPSAAVLRAARRAAIASIAALALAPACPGAVRAGFDHDALWAVVHGLCVPDQTHFQAPAPCVAVDLDGGEQGGFAIVKYILGRTQFLLVPTRRLAGIEDPLVGTDALPNYWRAAWTARKLVAENVDKDLSRDAIGMAINGAGARTQDQLHIHIDCVRADVRRALETHKDEIGAAWSSFRLLGRAYRARRIEGENPDPDPFRLLAEDKWSAPVRDNSLAVIGVRFGGGAPGFIVLAQRAPRGRTHAEDLLDHGCKVAAE